MYSFSDYLHRGTLLINNAVLPQNKKLSNVMFYVTDRCNLRCKHCYIWAKSPKQCLPLDIVGKVLSDKAVTSQTRIGVEGGEFLLHPEHEKILELLVRQHSAFDLLSNCMQPQKLIILTERYLEPLKLQKHPPRLFISLDGVPPSHDSLRGMSGSYANVLKVIETLHRRISISVMFTLTPFNTFSDLQHVIGICQKYGLDLRVGIYNNMQYFETKVSSLTTDSSLDYAVSQIPPGVKEFEENYDFMLLYHHYRRGNLSITCNSIRDSIVIYPNGDIPLCQNKEIILGNLHQETLSQIINKKPTCQLHKEYRKCNDCWINFHRKYDIVLYRNLERIFGKQSLEKVLGKYYWCSDSTKSYRNVIKETL